MRQALYSFSRNLYLWIWQRLHILTCNRQAGILSSRLVFRKPSSHVDYGNSLGVIDWIWYVIIGIINVTKLRYPELLYSEQGFKSWQKQELSPGCFCISTDSVYQQTCRWNMTEGLSLWEEWKDQQMSRHRQHEQQRRLSEQQIRTDAKEQ